MQKHDSKQCMHEYMNDKFVNNLDQSENDLVQTNLYL